MNVNTGTVAALAVAVLQNRAADRQLQTFQNRARILESEIAKLRERDRISQLQIAMLGSLDKGDYDAVKILAHGMKGAGGSYGFQAITDIGAALELAAERGDDVASRRSVGA